MRRCKYFYRYTWYYEDYITNQKKKASSVKCEKGGLPYVWSGIGDIPCLNGNTDCYTPVELDPYWKDVFDETNRRLYGR